MRKPIFIPTSENRSHRDLRLSRRMLMEVEAIKGSDGALAPL